MRIDAGTVKLNVVETGAGGPALVFLHYWGGAAPTWHQVTSWLAHSYRCTLFENEPKVETCIGLFSPFHKRSRLDQRKLANLSGPSLICFGQKTGERASTTCRRSAHSGGHP